MIFHLGAQPNNVQCTQPLLTLRRFTSTNEHKILSQHRQVYDFEDEDWSILTEKPGHVFGTPMCFLQVALSFFDFRIWYLFILRGMVTSLILQGKLYTLGGVQSKTVDQYDVETDTWANFFPSLRWSLQQRFSFTFLQKSLIFCSIT